MPISYRKPQQMTQAQAAHHQALQQQSLQQQYMQQAAQAQALQQHYVPQGTATTTVSNPWVNIQTGTLTTSTTSTSLANSVMNSLYAAQGTSVWPGDSRLVRDTLRLMGECAIADGEPCVVRLPDGGVLEVDADGSYRINDKDSKVTYRANRVRDFNPFVNASDKLEGFIQFCGVLGVRQDEMLNIPIKLFIGWLIIEAARADGEATDNLDLLEGIHDYRKPRCVTCGRFISPRIAARKIAVCRPVCLERELEAA